MEYKDKFLSQSASDRPSMTNLYLSGFVEIHLNFNTKQKV